MAGLKRHELAARLEERGVRHSSTETIERIEKRGRAAEADYLEALVRISGVDAHYLLIGERRPGAAETVLLILEDLFAVKPIANELASRAAAHLSVLHAQGRTPPEQTTPRPSGAEQGD